MLRFYGHDFELQVESVMVRHEGETSVCVATDDSGVHWLIVEAGGDTRCRSWVCAPASERAVEMVASGRAAPLDALLHSLTGWVEVVRVVDGHSVPDQRITCSNMAAAALVPA